MHARTVDNSHSPCLGPEAETLITDCPSLSDDHRTRTSRFEEDICFTMYTHVLNVVQTH